jgi:hypothetical protein
VTAIEYLDRPPAGWFVIAVMQKEKGGLDWAALMANVHPDDLRKGTFVRCGFKDGWVSVPGNYRNRDAAWDALEQAMATRH